VLRNLKVKFDAKLIN
jgi:hypothetical protein